MRVAIDSGPLKSGHKVRGVGVYTRELIRVLEQESKKLKHLKINAIDFEKEDLTKYDVVHYPYFDPFFVSLPKKKPRKLVVTIHDLTPLIYPNHYPAGIKGKLRFFIQKSLVKKADAIIADSETSKKDIVRFLDIPNKKIKVIRLAPSSYYKQITDRRILNQVIRKYNLPSKFVLYVGDVNFNKNIIGLIKACKIARTPLVICGKRALEVEKMGLGLKDLKGPKDLFRYLFNIPHPELSHFRELVKEFETNPNILRLGFVRLEDLVAIYNLASLYCQPSFYEGFGLPVLEAFACGCPVVVSKTNALTEVADGAAVVADPKDTKDLANKILMVLEDANLRASLIREGERRVKEFSWEKTARQTIDVYEKVISRQ